VPSVLLSYAYACVLKYHLNSPGYFAETNKKRVVSTQYGLLGIYAHFQEIFNIVFSHQTVVPPPLINGLKSEFVKGPLKDARGISDTENTVNVELLISQARCPYVMLLIR
jgi:hypothetical protein